MVAGESRNAGEISRLRSRIAELEGECRNLGRILDTAPLMLAVVRAPEMVFEYASPAFGALSGGEAPAGRRLDEVLGETAGRLAEAVRKAAAEGQACRVENIPAAQLREAGATPEQAFIAYTAIPLDGPGRGRILVVGEDTTEMVRLRRAEESALAQARLNETLFAHVHTGIAFVRGSDLRFLYVNPAYQAIAIGKQIEGRTLGEVWPEVRAQLEQIFRHVLETGEPYEATDAKYVIRRSTDGPLEEAYFSWMLTRVRAAGEEGWGLLNTCVETTERVLAQQAAGEGERRFKALAEGLPELVWTCAPDGRCDYLSRQWVEYTGIPEAEQLGYGWLAQLHPEDRERASAAWSETVGRGAERFDIEFRIRRHDGQYHWFKTQAIPLRNGAGEVVKWFGSNVDIENLKRTEERVRAGAAEWSTTFDSVADGICLVDADYRIVRANRSASLLFGRPAEQLRGRLCWEELYGANEPPADCPFQRMRASGKREAQELELNGRWLEQTADPIVDEEGRTRGAVHVLRDITERKRADAERAKLQEQLAQSQKMESIGRLAGGVAHDFNNLLTVINGYAKLLLAELMPGDRLEQYAAEIDRAGERAAELTRQLLAFGRKQMLQPRVLDLNRVLAGMQSLLRRLVGEDVEIRLELDKAAPSVHADPHQLEQVIMNLAVNARDAMPRGGQLLLKTSVDQGGGTERWAVLTVGDTGTGMDEATRKRIFEPFFTTKGPGQGTGLGLSMVQGIVEQSGGSIEVESAPERGTSFRILLPALAGAPAPAPEPLEPVEANGLETILVVEDQDEVREYTSAVLEAFGYRVLRADGGESALAVWEAEGSTIDLVLTDVVMPRMSGPELAERLDKLRPGVRVLFMSGYPDHVVEHHGEGVLNGETRFMQKPFRPEELARKVREALEG